VQPWQRNLRSNGFVCLDGPLSADELTQIGRVGPVHLLTPRDQENADPWSLSGIYGTGDFPWHTDGAVSPKPPRWIILQAMDVPLGTSTELHEPTLLLRQALARTVLRSKDRQKKVRYLPAILDEGEVWRLRWDPRTCTPRGEVTIERVQELTPSESIEWKNGLVLIFDNFRFLHRRPAVPAAARRVLARNYVWSD
jgi:alpha-ketoglutarate-dependent taurine dioxygenase